MAAPPAVVEEPAVAACGNASSGSSVSSNDYMTACYPAHPREALWKAGMFTLSEHRQIRKWIEDHPCSEDGKAQQSLWYHFRRQKKRPEKEVGDAFLPSHSVNILFRRERTYDFTPFVRPETEFVTKLQELGVAICADVAGEHGTPCTIGMFVEIKGGGFWTGHGDVTSERMELERNGEGGKWKDVAQKALVHLYTYFEKSMAT